MTILRAALLVAALAAPVAASATSFEEIAAKTSGASVAQTLADAMISHRPMMLEDAEATATQRYFDYDALLTLGALALSIGAFAAFARRPRDSDERRRQIDGVVRWMQDDLARHFAHPRDVA